MSEPAGECGQSPGTERDADTTPTRQTVGVAGVVRDASGRVLLIRTVTAGWELPGGRVEAGEDLLAALRREVLEETGCHAEPDTLAAVCSHLHPPGLVLFTFRCRYLDGTAAPGDDSLAAGWFTPDEARAMVSHVSERLRLLSGLSDEPGVDYRAYRLSEDAEGRPVSILMSEQRC